MSNYFEKWGKLIFKNYYRRIQFFDFWRNFFLGSLSPIVEVVAMLFFIEKFQASTLAKTSLAFALKSGFFIGVPISIFLFRKKFNLNLALFAFTLFAFVASLFSLLPLNPIVLVFLFAIMVFPFTGTNPLVAEIYNLYPQASRGKKFVSSNMAFFAGSIIFAVVYNAILKNDTYNHELIFLLTAFAVLFSGISTLPLPSLKFSGKKKPHLKDLFYIIKNDKLFLYVLIVWHIFGTANLWILPYRTNLLAEESFGFQYNETIILLLLVVLPEMLFIIFNIPFAYLFDKFNFIVMRIGLNVLFLLYGIFFFLGGSFTMHLIGMVCYGLGRAGGSIAWKLWVNKIVPPDKVSMYMNVHVAFTGVRMVISPLFGLVALYELGPQKVGFISISLYALSILLFIPLVRYGAKRFNH